MNKHIEIVKKWLADNDSVTQKELKNNAAAADAYNAYAAAYAAYAAAAAAYAAAADTGAAANADANATYWVKLYEELEQGE